MSAFESEIETALHCVGSVLILFTISRGNQVLGEHWTVIVCGKAVFVGVALIPHFCESIIAGYVTISIGYECGIADMSVFEVCQTLKRQISVVGTTPVGLLFALILHV